MAHEKSSRTGGNLPMPSQDYDLKRKEEELMLGQDLLLHVTLPDGQPSIDMRVKEANEVGYVKLLLAEKCGVSAGKIQLFFDNKQLIDPMSLCDHPGIKPPSVNLELRYRA